jgi:hypothetical protein
VGPQSRAREDLSPSLSPFPFLLVTPLNEPTKLMCTTSSEKNDFKLATGQTKTIMKQLINKCVQGCSGSVPVDLGSPSCDAKRDNPASKIK